MLSNKKLEALRAEDDALRARIAELDALDDDAVTDEVVEEYRSAVERIDALRPEIEAEEAFAAKAEAARSRVAEREQVATEDVAKATGPDVFVRGGRTPFDNLDAVRGGYVSGSDMRARAMTAIEELPDYIEDEGRERATRLLQGTGVGSRSDTDQIARHILLTGSKAYERAFQKILSDPSTGHMAMEDDERAAMRAAMSLTAANGGYLVPYFLDPTIMLTNDGALNPLREICTVKTITNDKWEGVTSAGVTAAYAAEAAVVADGSPTFGSPTITPQRAHAWIQGSFEVIEDASFAGEVNMLFADAKARLESTKFVLGAGEGSNEPDGIVTALIADTTPVASATSDTFAAADVYALEAALAPRFRSKGVFLGANGIYHLVRQFDSAGGADLWQTIGGGRPNELLGHPVYEAEAMDATITATQNNYVLAFFNPKDYVIVDRVGMRVMYEPLVKDTSTGRPTGQAGWYAFWRNSANLVNASAGKILNVT